MQKLQIIIFILFLTALILSIPSCVEKAKFIPYAKSGVLDLREWDFAENGNILQSGEWEFYWKQLLTPNDFTDGASSKKIGYIAVPSIWINESNLSAMGYATYRLNIWISNTNTRLAIKIPWVSTSYKLWIDRKYLIEVGKVGKTRLESYPQYYPTVIGFSPQGTNIEIVMQVANFYHYKGGLRESLLIGAEKKIRDFSKSNLAQQLFLAGSLIIMAIYHFALYFMRRKNKSPLYFGLLCFIISFRVLAAGENVLFYFFPFLGFELNLKLEFIPVYLGVPTLLAFIYSLYSVNMNKLFTRIMQIIGLAFTVFMLFTPARIFSYTFSTFAIIVAIVLFYIVLVLIKSIVLKSEGAIVFLVGFLIFSFTVINDMLFSLRISSLSFYSSSIGLLVFIVSQSIVLSLRFSRALETVETLSRSLESKVRERTSQLAERTFELEREQAKLRSRTEIIERELQFARNIQMQFIPMASPFPKLAFYYKPMDQIGGDFFDFVEFSADKIGILVSDVSGHGMPAALVTSMIKSFTLQFAEVIDNPAEFLIYLNGFLVNHTGGNFVTAFYGIFQFKTREFVYANAGHNMPFILNETGVSMLDISDSGIPLALFNEEFLAMRKKLPSNNTIILNKGDKIFLYTDGLTETVRIKDKESYPDGNLVDFETKVLISTLKDFSSLPSRELIEILERKLIDFRGADNFDDDVCMICLEV